MIRRNWLEWVTLTISSIVVISTFGYLSWLALTAENMDASLTATVGEIRQNGDTFDVSVTVRNEGDKTAENVRVNLVLETPGKGTDEAELMIPYVPYHSERKGTASFESDPREGRLTTAVRAYQHP